MISIQRIEELRAEVGPEDFAEIVALFLAESDQTLAALERAGDRQEADALLHALKGAALNLGFSELGRLCEDGRGGVIGGAEWPQALAHLAEVYSASKVELAALG